MELQLVTAPTLEPVSVNEAKHHLRVSDSQEDQFIDTLIKAARELAEVETERSFLTTRWKQTFRCWPGSEIRLERPPLQSVVSVAYVDENEASQTLTETTHYVVDTTSTPGKIWRAADTSWPSVSTEAPHPIEITFDAGWSIASTVPQSIKQAILLLVGHWYEHREAVTERNMHHAPRAAKALLAMNNWGHYT